MEDVVIEAEVSLRKIRCPYCGENDAAKNDAFRPNVISDPQLACLQCGDLFDLDDVLDALDPVDGVSHGVESFRRERAKTVLLQKAVDEFRECMALVAADRDRWMMKFFDKVIDEGGA